MRWPFFNPKIYTQKPKEGEITPVMAYKQEILIPKYGYKAEIIINDKGVKIIKQKPGRMGWLTNEKEEIWLTSEKEENEEK